MPVTHDTIEGAIKWLWDLDRLAGVSKTACVEAVLRACEDKQVSFTFICYQVVVGSRQAGWSLKDSLCGGSPQSL